MNVEKQKTVLSVLRKWLIDLGLVLLYTLFILGCIFLAVSHKDWGFWHSLVSVILFSACIGFIHHNINRTMKVFFLASILNVVLNFAWMLYSDDVLWGLILSYSTYLLFPSILGGTIGYFIAEKRKE